MTTNITSELHRIAEQALPDLGLLIGWGAGYDGLHTTPVFIRDPGAVSKLVWNPFCAQNLTGYLVKSPEALGVEAGKKIGICVKGCDSRSLTALIQEKLIERERLHIIGIPCRGVVDARKLASVQNGSRISAARVDGNHVEVEDGGVVRRIPIEDVLLRRCKRCLYPNPVMHDVLVGEPVSPRISREDAYSDVSMVEGLSLEERLSFWQRELGRCMRCYACRNACPLCICQDRCIAETRDPKWLAQYMDMPEKFMFHFIHALHLAGRCTECGECERVCPMEIPVALIKEELNKITKELFDFEAGINPEGVPPLLTFSPGEAGI